MQLALEMSRSESQEVKEEIPLVESNKENQQQVEVEGEKVEENPDVSSNILDKTDMTSDGPSNICDINSKRESNFKPGKKILHHEHMCIVLIHCNVFYEVLTPFG